MYQQQFSLQLMQDYGVNLICVEDGIDSSKEAGKLLIPIIAAVAEMERENIRVQTMAGREQKAREVSLIGQHLMQIPFSCILLRFP